MIFYGKIISERFSDAMFRRIGSKSNVFEASSKIPSFVVTRLKCLRTTTSGRKKFLSPCIMSLWDFLRRSLSDIEYYVAPLLLAASIFCSRCLSTTSSSSSPICMKFETRHSSWSNSLCSHLGTIILCQSNYFKFQHFIELILCGKENSKKAISDFVN